MMPINPSLVQTPRPPPVNIGGMQVQPYMTDNPVSTSLPNLEVEYKGRRGTILELLELYKDEEEGEVRTMITAVVRQVMDTNSATEDVAATVVAKRASNPTLNKILNENYFKDFLHMGRSRIEKRNRERSGFERLVKTLKERKQDTSTTAHASPPAEYGPWTSQEFLDDFIFPLLGNSIAISDALGKGRKAHPDWSPVELLTRASYQMVLRFFGAGQRAMYHTTISTNDIKVAIDRPDYYEKRDEWEATKEFRDAVARFDLEKIDGFWVVRGRYPPNFRNCLASGGGPNSKIKRMGYSERKLLQGVVPGQSPPPPSRAGSPARSVSVGSDERSSSKSPEAPKTPTPKTPVRRTTASRAPPTSFPGSFQKSKGDSAGKRPNTRSQQLPVRPGSAGPSPTTPTAPSPLRQSSTPDKRSTPSAPNPSATLLPWSPPVNVRPPVDLNALAHPSLSRHSPGLSGARPNAYDFRPSLVRTHSEYAGSITGSPAQTPAHKHARLVSPGAFGQGATVKSVDLSSLKITEKVDLLGEDADIDFNDYLADVPLPSIEDPAGRRTSSPLQKAAEQVIRRTSGSPAIKRAQTVGPPAHQKFVLKNPLQNPQNVEVFAWNLIVRWVDAESQGQMSRKPQISSNEINQIRQKGLRPVLEAFDKILKSWPGENSTFGYFMAQGGMNCCKSLLKQLMEKDGTMKDVWEAVKGWNREFQVKDQRIRYGNAWNGGVTIGYAQVVESFMFVEGSMDGWLSGEMILACTAAIRGSQPDNWCVIPSHDWTNYVEREDPNTPPTYWKGDPGVKKAIPVHLKNHWMLLAVDVDKVGQQTIYALDSAKQRDENDRHVRALRNLCSPTAKFSTGRSNQQLNFSDCGLFVIENFRALYNGPDSSVSKVEVNFGTRMKLIKELQAAILAESKTFNALPPPPPRVQAPIPSSGVEDLTK